MKAATLNSGPPGHNQSAPQEVKLARQLKELGFLAEYRMIATLQRPFEFIFWALEQRKGKLADKLANEDMGQP